MALNLVKAEPCCKKKLYIVYFATVCDTKRHKNQFKIQGQNLFIWERYQNNTEIIMGDNSLHINRKVILGSYKKRKGRKTRMSPLTGFIQALEQSYSKEAVYPTR